MWALYARAVLVPPYQNTIVGAPHKKRPSCLPHFLPFLNFYLAFYMYFCRSARGGRFTRVSMKRYARPLLASQWRNSFLMLS